MSFLKDWHQLKAKEPQTLVVKPPESPPRPANALEQIVHDVPPVVDQLKKTEDQLRQDALQTMAYLEDARQEKGNFCLTLGEGNKRAVFLIAPVEGIKAEDFVKKGQEAGYTQAVTRTDYVLLTAEGPRRISFSQVDSSPLYSGDKLKTRNDWATLQKERLKGIVDRLVKKGEVDLKYSMYQEWPFGDGDIDVNLSIDIPGSKLDSDKFHINTRRYGNKDFVHSSISGIITDDVTPLQALKNSLNSVQSPLQVRIADAQKQIGSVKAIGQSLK